MTGADSNHPRRLRTILLLFCVYLALTVAYTWPLPIKLAHGITHDPGDPLLNAWILWWSTQTVPLTGHWWNAAFFYPAPGVLAFSEHLLGLVPIAAPIIAVTKLPLLGYNIALLATFVFSALGAHFLGYTLTRRHDAALLAGVAFAFAPYRLAQVPHIQVLASYWTPVCLAALHLYGRSGRLQWAFLAGAAWLLQALSCGYYLFFLSVLVGLWMLWFAIGRWPLKRIGTVALIFGGAAVLLGPILYRYQVILQDTYGLSRAIGEVRMFSADIAGLLLASDDLLIWRWVHLIQRPESALFPGLTIVVLTIVAIAITRPFEVDRDESATRKRLRLSFAVLFIILALAAVIPIVHGPWRLRVGGIQLLSISRGDKPLTLALIAATLWMLTLPRVRAALTRRSALAFYVLGAFVMWVCALGPDPTFLDTRAIYQAPYGFLIQLPGFEGLRVPARFWMMALACLGAVAALSVKTLTGQRRRVVIAVALAGLLLDGWPRQFVMLDAPARRPSPSGVSTRLDLPTGDNDPLAMYQQTAETVALYNGYSGYFAPHYYAMTDMLARHDTRIVQALAASGSLGIVVDHAGDADGAIRRWLMSMSGVVRERDAADWSSYRVPVTGVQPLPDRSGEPVPIKSLDAYPSPPHAARALDNNLVTRWSGGPQQQSSELIVELEQPTRVHQVVLDLGGYVTDFPKRLQIDISFDGRSWQAAWVGDTALHAYYGALRHPREFPLVFPLDRDQVQFIRLRQTGFGTPDWSVAELHVLR